MMKLRFESDLDFQLQAEERSTYCLAVMAVEAMLRS